MFYSLYLAFYLAKNKINSHLENKKKNGYYYYYMYIYLY